MIVGWWENLVAKFVPPKPQKSTRYVPTSSLAKQKPQKAPSGARGPAVKPWLGSAENVRSREVKAADYGPNLYKQAQALRSNKAVRAQGYMANPSRGKVYPEHAPAATTPKTTRDSFGRPTTLATGTVGTTLYGGRDSFGVSDTRKNVTVDDWLADADERLKTKLGYQGLSTQKTVEGDEYKKLTKQQQLGAQYNSLLRAASDLDFDMYSDMDSDSDGRVSWKEAKNRTQQKGARKAFEEVYGRAPTDTDTYNPNVAGLLNQMGVRDLGLYTEKDQSDILNDLYLTREEVEELQNSSLVRNAGEAQNRFDLTSQLYEGLGSLQSAFTDSKGVAVTEGISTEYSPLDLTKFDQDQRSNLVMLIGEGLKDAEPNVLLTLESSLDGVLNDPRYSKPGENGLDLTSLADPSVRKRMQDMEQALGMLIEYGANNPLSEDPASILNAEDVTSLLSGKDVDVPGAGTVTSDNYLSGIDNFLQGSGLKVSGKDLIDFAQRQAAAQAAAQATGPSGKTYRSVAGDPALRSRLYGATKSEAVEQQRSNMPAAEGGIDLNELSRQIESARRSGVSDTSIRRSLNISGKYSAQQIDAMLGGGYGL